MLYVFVEGPDDETFINGYFRLIGFDADSYYIITYANKTKKYVNGFIKSINCMADSDYVLLADADAKEVEERKKLINDKYRCLSIDRIFIVQNEIESWYLAGLSEEDSKELGFKNYYTTNIITKEDFNNSIGNKSKIIIIAKILEVFCIAIAIEKNTTFKVFHESRIYEKCK